MWTAQHGSVSERRFAAWDAGTMSKKGAPPAAHRQIQTRVCGSFVAPTVTERPRSKVVSALRP